MTRFAGRALVSIITPRYYPGQLWQQFVEMFFFSLPVIGLTGLFTGMVLALQGEAALSRLSANQRSRKSWPSAYCANWAPSSPA